MQKNKLSKLALLGLSALVVFGCQAKAELPEKKTSDEMNTFMNRLTPEQRQRFDQLTDEQKEQAMQSAVAVKKKFYDSLTPDQKQRFDQMTDEQKDQAFQSALAALKNYYDSLSPEQKQRFDQMSDAEKYQALQSAMDRMKNSPQTQKRMPATSPSVQ